jgi:hypothetical protein
VKAVGFVGGERGAHNAASRCHWFFHISKSFPI